MNKYLLDWLYILVMASYLSLFWSSFVLVIWSDSYFLFLWSIYKNVRSWLFYFRAWLNCSQYFCFSLSVTTKWDDNGYVGGLRQIYCSSLPTIGSIDGAAWNAWDSDLVAYLRNLRTFSLLYLVFFLTVGF